MTCTYEWKPRRHVQLLKEGILIVTSYTFFNVSSDLKLDMTIFGTCNC